jgi:hypothetical protein
MPQETKTNVRAWTKASAARDKPIWSETVFSPFHFMPLMRFICPIIFSLKKK